MRKLGGSDVVTKLQSTGKTISQIGKRERGFGTETDCNKWIFQIAFTFYLCGISQPILIALMLGLVQLWYSGSYESIVVMVINSIIIDNKQQLNSVKFYLVRTFYSQCHRAALQNQGPSP